jgi:predicted ester cyclase
MDLYAEDAVLATPDGTYDGRDKIHEYFARQMAGFPDCRYILGDLVEQSEELADEFTWVGTHTATYVLPDGTELPPTGKRVEIRAMEMVQLRDGKMVVDNLYWDKMDLAVQLGLIPQGVLATAS